jgi:dihydroorotate dehydrogenase (fumarate)
MSSQQLQTHYLGLQLKNPFVVGASPLSDTVDGARILEDMGAAAIVVRSLFNEQVAGRPFRAPSADSTRSRAQWGAGSSSRFPFGPEDYVEHVGRLKEALAIPVIASLNAAGPGSWLDYPPLLEKVGADAVELNLYCAGVSPWRSGAEVEEALLRAVAELRHAVRLPIAVKVTPFFSSLAHFARGAESAGAGALVLFNRFFPASTDRADLPRREGPATALELDLRIGWVAALSSQVRSDLAVSGGVYSGEDAGRAIEAGAHVVQVVSALLEHGPDRLVSLCDELRAWLAVDDRVSVAGCRGRMNLDLCPDPAGYERASYIVALQGWSQARGRKPMGATRERSER